MAIQSRLVGFATALRQHGFVAGPSEVIDAAAIATTLGWDDRDRLREGMAAALMRRAGQRQVFDDLFDVWFPTAVGARTDVAVLDPPPPDPAARRDRAAQLRELLSAALAAGDESALDAIAARTVAELGRLPNEPTTGSFSAQQALETLAPQTAIAGALARDVPGESFVAAYRRDELRSAVAQFRRRVETETRRRNAEARGADRIGRYAVRSPAELQPFLLAGATEIEELRRTIDPLARKLATRLAARRRRASRGEIDLRRTLRASLSTGGVPVRPAYRHKPPRRPDLVVLADLSQSVAGFSRFTILLMQALAAQFRRLRVIGFVNVCDDLTDLVTSAPPGSDLGPLLQDTARMTRGHRNSDYGSTFADAVERYADVFGPRTVVLILGDARSNGTNPCYDALREIVDRSRQVSWLNPDPARMWGSGDSLAHRYSEIVDMHECSNAAQLRQFVARLMPL